MYLLTHVDIALKFFFSILPGWGTKDIRKQWKQALYQCGKFQVVQNYMKATAVHLDT